MTTIAKSDNVNTTLGKYTQNMKKALKKVNPKEKFEIEKLLDEIENMEELEDDKIETNFDSLVNRIINDGLDANVMERLIKEYGAKKFIKDFNNIKDAEKRKKIIIAIKERKIPVDSYEKKTSLKGLFKHVDPLLQSILDDGPYLSEDEKEEEVEEATGAASAGAYVGPLGHAKNEKNWRGAAKTQWPGGKFVKVKEKCRKFPYCNQGDIDALELWDSVLEKKVMRETIEKVSKKTGKPKKDIKKLIQKELDEIIRRSFYKSPVTSLVGNFKINKPTGKIFSMTPKGVSNKYE
jgi:hypothetical protein